METNHSNTSKQGIFQFEVKLLNGTLKQLSEYQGKTIVIVNTASKCGLTPQYEGLEKLYQKYQNQGLVVLGFPCNQFGHQEAGSAEEIAEFCQINYGVSFPIFEKIEVNGSNAHPLFKFLKSKLGGGLLGSAIKWNFTKFVIDKYGVPKKRFSPTSTPESMEDYLKSIL
jgi:glutathione peroxidase